LGSKPGQVAADAQAIRVLRQRMPVVAFVNNHVAGYAPDAVRQLVALARSCCGPDSRRRGAERL
jgi:hypothetical protein